MKPIELSLDRPEEFLIWLRDEQLIGRGEEVLKIERAGSGNMNLVVRLHTPQKKWVLKIARPWVEKYPQIPAPANRGRTESVFYQEAALSPRVAQKVPKLLLYRSDIATLVFEDLGVGEDLSLLYRRERKLAHSEIKNLLEFLKDLHEICPKPALLNQEMRLLNAQHIFDIPFQGILNLESTTVGLTAVGLAWINGFTGLERVLEKLRAAYWMPGTRLVHGDFYLGSVFKTEAGSVFVLDPEFSFSGSTEFDHGVFAAHLFLTGHENAARDIASTPLISGFVGVEMARRLLGVAQLPLQATLEEKSQWLDDARVFMEALI